MPEYDFSTLSPVDFEALTADVLNAEFKVHVESFGPGRDKGVDLRCALAGADVVIQCKHYLRGGRSALRRSVQKEVQKWKGVRGISRYILVTSASMTVEFKEELAGILRKHLPVATGDILGREDLNALLLRHSEVELRHFKLWTSSAAVLSRIIHSGLWNRTEELLESIESRAKFYVLTDHFARTVQVLEEHNLCVVTGPPGVGKSILAEMVLLAHWKEGWQVVQISEDVKEGFDLWNPQQPQIFYYDDFLGQTDLAETTGKNEDHRIAQFAEKVRRATPGTKRFILTTREQILRNAQERSDRIRRAGASLVPSEVRVEDYSDYTKALIFYNHLYFSELPPADRKALVDDRAYLDVIRHTNYSPRILEQTLRYQSHNLDALLSNLRSSLDDPSELWASSYNHLSPVGRRILSILVTHPPRGIDERDLRKCVQAKEPHTYIQALKVLEGTWLTISNESVQRAALANPSCRDFLLHKINGSPAMADAVLADVQDIRQALMLLRYSGLDKYRKSKRDERVTKAWEKLEYKRLLWDIHDVMKVPSGVANEGLREALLENSSDFIGKIRHLYGERVSVWKATVRKKRNGYRVTTPDPRPEMLSTVMHFISENGTSDDISWCRSEVESQVSAENGLPAGTVESYVTLAVNVQVHPFGSEDLVQGILKRSFEEFYDPSDVELFFDVFDPREFDDKMRNAAYAAFMTFADGEFKHWSTERDYQESRNAADFVEGIAEKFDAPVQRMLEEWRRSADEREADEEESQRFAESPGSWATGRSSAADGGRIVELFSTLIEE
ncbi:restriction endonuclease [Streptomyces sp. WMMC905]|uniref:nSTAND3 domain-containing NTPase n=1 Tax=Streptomyces sp. WMMC905 TaxID=3404123 RepID=UPI003B938896